MESNWNEWWQKATCAYMSALQGDGPYYLLDMDKGKKAFEEGMAATAYGVAEAAWQNVWITKKRIPSPMLTMEQDPNRKYPQTFKELFEGTGIEPTKDKEGNEHYNFKAVKKDSNYFTPSIEDIRVGYECEVAYLHKDNWTPVKYRHQEETRDGILAVMDYNIRIRVPYLTKEQIEAEGWNLDHVSIYRKGDYSLRYPYSATENSEKESNMFLYRWDDTLFDGQCRDINTFRYICKLLGI